MNTQKVVDWLKDDCELDHAQKATVTINSARKSVQMQGAVYTNHNDALALYLLGNYETWPKVIRDAVYEDGDGDIWYVVSYLPKNTKPDQDFQPFGHDVILFMASFEYAKQLRSENNVLRMEWEIEF